MSNRRKLKINSIPLRVLRNSPIPPELDNRPGAKEAINCSTTEGMINAYRCDDCEKHRVVVHVDRGVTPMFLGCPDLNCNGRGVSLGYPDQNNIPDKIRNNIGWEWYRPEYSDKIMKDPGMRQHIKQGGLALRERG